MGQVIIREFIPQDQAVFLQFSKSFYSTDAVLHPIPEEHFYKTFQQCLENSPYVRGLALLWQEKIAGYALLSFTWSNEAGGLCILLEEIYVDPAYQGLGIGNALFTYIQNTYADKAKRFRLEVTRSNQRAIQLYQRMGYSSIEYLQMVKDL